MARILLVALVLLGLAGEAEAREPFKYVDAVYPAKRLSIDVERSQFLVADVAEEMRVCNPHDPFICVESTTVSFHFPRNFKDGQKRWVGNGLEYRIEAVEEYKIWGRQERLMRIRMTSRGESTLYLYSEQLGLMGVGFVDRKTHAYAMYLVASKCGFGSSAGC